jgi:predicted extracellular nuclease
VEEGYIVLSAARSRRRLLPFFGSLLVLTGLLPVGAAVPVLAVSPDVVISQVYGGGGNSGATYTHDYVELFNRGTTSVSLTSYSLQYGSTTGNIGATTTTSTPLSGSIAAGQYALVQEAPGAGGTTALPTPDVTDASPIAMSATAGKVALVNSTTGLNCGATATPCGASQLAQITDLVGYGASNMFEGSAAAPVLTNTTAAFRAGSGCTDTDDNAADFTADVPGPRNTGSPLNTCGVVADTGPSVSSIAPQDNATGIALASDLTITFSEAVAATAPWFEITCSISGSHTAAVSGGPTVFTLNPDANFVESETCDVTVVASQIADTDTNDPPDTMAANFTSDFATVSAPGNVCDEPFTPIYSIQGSGPSAAITGTVTTAGVVVGDFEGPNGVGIGGFYLQDPTGDGDPATSDGIFVFTGSANVVAAGDLVRVTGYARERFDPTTASPVSITAIMGANNSGTAVPAANIVACGEGPTISPVDVTLPFSTLTEPERYEGMLVNLPQDLVISEYFNYDQFGEIVLAKPLNDEDRPYTPTSIVEPGAPAIARAQANALSRLTLDDGIGGSNPTSLRHPNGDPFSLTNRFRGGDKVTNTVGVLSFDFNLYRIMPTAPATYTEVNPRPVAPDPVGGTIHAAAMNTLNFFLTLDTTASDSGPGPCGGNANLDCRGADSSQPDEFSRQRTKLLQALVGLDADIIGLNEIENTPGVSPLGDPTNGIVAGLNTILGPGTYDYIDTGVIGTDAIRVGLIYKPGKVTPVGAFQVLNSTVDPRFVDTRSRPVLAQTFEDNASGGRVTVAVNHLKSKGSGCADLGDPDALDGQGNCNGTRTLAAQALVDWLATDPTGAGDPDYLILGDLNSYAQEDPIDAIKAGSDDTVGTADDYTNLIAAFQGTFAHSYVFDGQAGYLDHALASSTLVDQVTGAADWHIDSDEPDVVDYDTSFKPASQEALYEPNQYRASDHDPVVVGLDLNTGPSVDAGGPYAVNSGATVQVSATGNDPDGRPLTYAWDLDNNETFETSGQTVTFDASAITGPATLTINVQVTDAGGATATDSATVVVNAHPTADAGGPYTVVEGQTVTVSATGSDPESGALTYAWDLDNNGSFETAGQTATYTAAAGSAPASPTIRVRVTDPLGLTAIDSATVNIIWNFSGFLSPLANPPVENKANSGAAILIGFRLGGNQGLAVIAAGYPRSIQYTCGTAVGSRPTDATTPTVNAGFSYNAATATYTYSWKTDKGWSNTCRRFVLKLTDGTFHYLDVNFRK